MTEPVSAKREPVSIVVTACIHCGSCAVLAPEIFHVDRRVSAVIRQPATAGEWLACDAARINCPASAILGDVR